MILKQVKCLSCSIWEPLSVFTEKTNVNFGQSTV